MYYINETLFYWFIASLVVVHCYTTNCNLAAKLFDRVLEKESRWQSVLMDQAAVRNFFTLPSH